VARASLEELRLDYQDFLRHRGLEQWRGDDPRRQELIDQRPASAEEVADWVGAVRDSESGRGGRSGRSGQPEGGTQSTRSTASTPPTYSEIAANGALVLINVACALLDRQIVSLAMAFEEDGGFSERMYRTRTGRARH
jgi:four helix bundle suffix protein